MLPASPPWPSSAAGVVHSIDDTLTATDLALGYKQLQQVEQAWRTLKCGLRLRPVYHWAPDRIHARVSLTALALLLERATEQACGETWRNPRDDLKPMKLAQLSSVNGTVWQVTEPSPDTTKRLKALKIPKPPRILDPASAPEYTAVAAPRGNPLLRRRISPSCVQLLSKSDPSIGGLPRPTWWTATLRRARRIRSGRSI